MPSAIRFLFPAALFLGLAFALLSSGALPFPAGQLASPGSFRQPGSVRAGSCTDPTTLSTITAPGTYALCSGSYSVSPITVAANNVHILGQQTALTPTQSGSVFVVGPASGTTISGITFTGSPLGSPAIAVQGSPKFGISGNTFISIPGVSAGFSGTAPAKGGTITGNQFQSSTLRVENGIFDPSGGKVAGVSNLIIQANSFSSPQGVALYLGLQSTGITVSGNSLKAPFYPTAVEDCGSGNAWDNGLSGNYYSWHDEPAEGCTDANGDFRCDAPYPIFCAYQAISKDNAPLTKPTTCGDGAVDLVEACDGGEISCTLPDGWPGIRTCLPNCAGYGSCTNQTNQTHLACVFDMCLPVPGAGPNLCFQNSSGCNSTNSSIDLTVLSLKYSIVNVSNGTNSSNISVNFTTVVKNIGAAAAPGFVTLISADFPGNPLSYPSLSGLAPGQEVLLQALFPKPPPGQYAAQAVADIFGTVLEANEYNNALAINVTIP